MFGIAKHKVQIWCVIISSGIVGCTSPIESVAEVIHVEGETQGTTYEIIIADEKANFTKTEIDSVLAIFDQSLSTYIPTSKISLLNALTLSGNVIDSTGFFKSCYLQSQAVFNTTDGAFDPSVFPLVKGWGFMDKMETPLNQSEVDKLLLDVGFDKHHSIDFKGDSIGMIKQTPGFKLDFNAIAQGYSVDVLVDFLTRRGQKNFYVEIGGELALRGTNSEGEQWRIGIDVPKENSTTHEIENIVQLSDLAIATSGNYRKFYEKDGKKYPHFLNPKTGFPVEHSLLSVSVIAPSCASADAYATAFMVMGAEQTLDFVKNHPDLELEVYLLESNGEKLFKRSMSPGFKTYLRKS